LDHTEKELRRHEPASRARGAHAALPSARGSRVLASLDDAAGAQAAPWLRVQLAAAGALLTLHEWHAEARLSRFLHGWRHQLFAELPETPAGAPSEAAVNGAPLLARGAAPAAEKD